MKQPFNHDLPFFCEGTGKRAGVVLQFLAKPPSSNWYIVVNNGVEDFTWNYAIDFGGITPNERAAGLAAAINGHQTSFAINDVANIVAKLQDKLGFSARAEGAFVILMANRVGEGNDYTISSNAPTNELYLSSSSFEGGEATAVTVSSPVGQQQFNTVSASNIKTADGTVFTIAAGQIGFIQNLDDAPLLVKLGANASTSDFHYSLLAGTAADDGKGGSIEIKNWIGAVSIKAFTGSPRCSAFTLSA